MELRSNRHDRTYRAENYMLHRNFSLNELVGPLFLNEPVCNANCLNKVQKYISENLSTKDSKLYY